MIETAVYENARPSSNLSVLGDMSESSFPNEGIGTHTKISPLPSLEIGASFVNAYLSYIHPNFPFIPKKTLWEAHQSRSDIGDASPDEAKHNFVMIQLVYAIGSRCLQLVGSATAGLEPEGHYLAAMAKIQDQMNLPSIRNIHIILLVAIYALRSPLSTFLVWQAHFHRSPLFNLIRKTVVVEESTNSLDRIQRMAPVQYNDSAMP
jgi:hypothetical protein